MNIVIYLIGAVVTMFVVCKSEQTNTDDIGDNLMLLFFGVMWPMTLVLILAHVGIRTIAGMFK